METYRYCTFDEDNKGAVVDISRGDILASFYDYWISRMKKKYTEPELAEMDLEEMCVQDFVVNNWAWKIKE